MSHDDLRIRAHIIALTSTLNATLKAVRDHDPTLLTGLLVSTEHEITKITGEGSELQRAALVHAREAILEGA